MPHFPLGLERSSCKESKKPKERKGLCPKHVSPCLLPARPTCCCRPSRNAHPLNDSLHLPKNYEENHENVLLNNVILADLFFFLFFFLKSQNGLNISQIFKTDFAVRIFNKLGKIYYLWNTPNFLKETQTSPFSLLFIFWKGLFTKTVMFVLLAFSSKEGCHFVRSFLRAGMF